MTFTKSYNYCHFHYSTSFLNVGIDPPLPLEVNCPLSTSDRNVRFTWFNPLYHDVGVAKLNITAVCIHGNDSFTVSHLTTAHFSCIIYMQPCILHFQVFICP